MDYSKFIDSISTLSDSKYIIPFILNSTGFDQQNVMLTSVRRHNDFLCPTLIVSSQCAANKLSTDLSKFSKFIFVDIEKKIEYVSSSNHIELGNIFTSVLDLGLKIPIYPFKANDITVQSAFEHITSIYSDIAGLDIGIIGVGNIGSKIAQKVVESGSNVTLFSRDISHASDVSLYINKCKSKFTLSGSKVANSIDQVFFSCDCIILANNYSISLSDFSLECLHQQSQKPKLVLQIGHNILEHKLLAKANQNSPFTVQRLDITTEFLRLALSRCSIDYCLPTALSDLQTKNAFAAYGFMGSQQIDIVNNIHTRDNIIHKNSMDNNDYYSKYFTFDSGILDNFF